MPFQGIRSGPIRLRSLGGRSHLRKNTLLQRRPPGRHGQVATHRRLLRRLLGLPLPASGSGLLPGRRLLWEPCGVAEKSLLPSRASSNTRRVGIGIGRDLAYPAGNRSEPGALPAYQRALSRWHSVATGGLLGSLVHSRVAPEVGQGHVDPITESGLAPQDPRLGPVGGHPRHSVSSSIESCCQGRPRPREFSARSICPLGPTLRSLLDRKAVNYETTARRRSLGGLQKAP